MTDDDIPTRTQASTTVEPWGWRFVLGTLRTTVAVTSLADGVARAQQAVAAAGDDADGHLRVDVRADQVQLALCSATAATTTRRDLDLAGLITRALADQGATTQPGPVGGRPVQYVEFAIDALDIPAIRPFWRAVLGYGDEPGHDGPDDAIVDPVGQGPSLWFQQMDEPRTQRNRFHIDITVGHDEAPGRLQAALEAGGLLVTDAYAPSFWVLADVEGNEVCVCTWQGRDERAAAEEPIGT